jgi:hypothetical protein
LGGNYRRETHQICFCTLNSLQTIDRIDDTPTFDVVMISAPIIEQIMFDFTLDELEAADMFYNSEAYSRLSDENTKLYTKDWQAIYELFKKEFE